MRSRRGQNRRGGPCESSPLNPRHHSSYGSSSSGPQSPPPYSVIHESHNIVGREASYADARQQDSLPIHPAVFIERYLAGAIITLILVAQLVAFVFFYDLPTKLDRYNEAMARMRIREDAIKKESKHFEQEKLALKEERERWEKARDDRVPRDAFWEAVLPAPDCLSYGKREYSAILRNIPEDWTDMDACMNMPVEIMGANVRRPNRCQFVEGSPHIRGFWTVDWDQIDCQPWHRDFDDRGCTNPGSRTRRIEAWVVGINVNGGQNWRLLCESTPMTWRHITYNTPTHCDERFPGKKVAMWDIPDGSC